MLISLKVAMMRKGIKQTRMAVDLGWDPAKLSRIVNELGTPSAEDRKLIAAYLGASERQIFPRTRNRERRPAAPMPANTSAALRTA